MHPTATITLFTGLLAAALVGVDATLPRTRAQTTRPAAGNSLSITLPTIPTDLPEGPGKQTVAATCSVCHSPRYITMQPKFTRAAWMAEVQKMVKNYGAPVPPQQADEIVNYLFSIRGIQESQASR